MSVLDNVLGNVVGKATAAASDAAAAKAAATYEQYKPLVYAAVFLAATVYLFYFFPRFTLPWKKAPKA